MSCKGNIDRIIFVQPTIPRYREAFFEGLSDRLGDRLAVYASNMKIGAISQSDARLPWKKLLGDEQWFLPGLSWQKGTLGIEITRGDLVVVSGAPRCLSNIGLLAKARRAGAKTMWWGHFWSSTSKKWRTELRLKLLSRADSALFYTDLEVEEFHKQFPERRNFRVFALNNGIDNREIKNIRTGYKASQREKRILFIGRLTEKSRFADLLQALAFEACSDLSLDVIGDGKDLSELRQYSERCGVSKRVTWYGGLDKELRISRIANRSRLFVYPGGVGLSLIHALAYGLPVVVHNDRWGHMPEIAAFREGVNGVSFDIGSIESLATATSCLITDESRLDKMSREAVLLTDQAFNTSNMVERFMQALEAMEN